MPIQTRRRTLLWAVGLVLGGVGPAVRRAAASTSDLQINTDANRVAVAGFDVVAYYLIGKAVPGDSSHEVVHGGARYWFSTAEHAHLFRLDPDAYLPTYGGYCAFGVATGKKIDVDPQSWDIVNGKLYLHLDRGIQVVWQRKYTKYIAVADRIWPAIQAVPPRELKH